MLQCLAYSCVNLDLMESETETDVAWSPEHSRDVKTNSEK